MTRPQNKRHQTVSAEFFTALATVLLLGLSLMCFMQVALSMAYFSWERQISLTAILDGASWHAPDHYFVLKDFRSYLDAKLQANRDYRDSRAFARKCLMNVSSAGKFSSDRTITQYAREIWNV